MPKRHAPRFVALVDAARNAISETDVATIRDRIYRGDDFHLLDVREESEWARGHLPGAVHLSRGTLERDIEAAIPDLDADIVLYCGGGYRSALSAERLGQMGYTNVVSMDGGFRGWTESGGAVETDAVTN